MPWQDYCKNTVGLPYAYGKNIESFAKRYKSIIMQQVIIAMTNESIIYKDSDYANTLRLMINFVVDGSKGGKIGKYRVSSQLDKTKAGIVAERLRQKFIELQKNEKKKKPIE